MADYLYVKSDIHPQMFTREIEEDEAIVTELSSITFDAPSSLKASFTSQLSEAEETALDALVAAHDSAIARYYNVWCDNCGVCVEYWGTEMPTVCPISGEETDKLVDVTFSQPAVHGYAVREDDQSGYYEWWIPGGNHRRYSKQRMFIAYDSRLTYVPTITFGTVIYDGLANLQPLFAGREGFVVEATVVQTKKRFGGLNVKFTWTGVKS